MNDSEGIDLDKEAKALFFGVLIVMVFILLIVASSAIYLYCFN